MPSSFISSICVFFRFGEVSFLFIHLLEAPTAIAESYLDFTEVFATSSCFSLKDSRYCFKELNSDQ